MYYAIYSKMGDGMSWWKRLQDEGHTVLVYIHDQPMQRIGEGIVPKTNNQAQWLAWGKLHKAVFFFDLSGCGEMADQLRKGGHLVVGGCKFFDKLEKERAWSEELHKSIGILAPETKEFKTIGDAMKFAQTKGDDKVWVFKSNKFLDASSTYMSQDSGDLVRYLTYVRNRWGDNISNILQEKLDGIAFSTARWWNGRSFVGPFEATVEHKKFMDGDVGPATGCSFNCIWFYRNEFPDIARQLHWDKLDDVFRKYEAAPGLYDINALISKDDNMPYFLESTPRCGYDSEPTSQKGISDLGKLLYNLATAQPVDDLFDRTRYFDSIRLSVEPYPWEFSNDPKKSCLDTPVWGNDGLWEGHFIGYALRQDPKLGLVLADPLGCIGLSSAAGKDPLSPFKTCYAFVKDKLQVPNLQYRTDAEKCVQADLKQVSALGYDTR
jgi:phosphoribosylamine--glycine ligase